MPKALQTKPNQPPPKPAPVERWIGAPPLLPGEDSAAYDDILTRVSSAVGAADFIEEIWVQDVVHAVWEVLRLRRLKAQLLRDGRHFGAGRLLNALAPCAEDSEASEENAELAADWLVQHEPSVRKVEQALASAGFTTESVMAETLMHKIEEIERIERMSLAAEMRRDTALREIERRRATLGARLRQQAQQIEDEIEDAELVTVAPQPAPQRAQT